MSADFEKLLAALRARGDALGSLPADVLTQVTDEEFEACATEIREWRGGHLFWIEQQALRCARARQLVLLRILLEHVRIDDFNYAADATSGGEGAARTYEINQPGFNPEADRIRGLMRDAILG
jgi:hypothetical protein